MYYAMVAEQVADRNLWDDLVQEAAIHVWRLRRRGGEHTEAYYRKAARMRIRECASRQTWLGHTGRQGVPIDPLRRPHDSLDRIREEEGEQWR